MAAGLVVLTVLKCGFSTYPAVSGAVLVAKALPGVPGSTPYEQFIYSSPLGPLLARMVGALTVQTYVVLHAVILIFGLGGLLFAVWRSRGERAARLTLLALCCTSLPMILLSWIGSYDVFTFVIGSLLVVVEAWPVLIVLAVLLGLAHFEQGLFIVAALLVLSTSRRWGRVQHGLMLIGGLLAGKALLTYYLKSLGVVGSRWLWVVSPLDEGGGLLGRLTHNLPTLLYSLLGGGWVLLLLIAFVVGREWPESKRALVVLAALLVPVLVTLDQTRVYAIISWPVIMYLMLLVDERASDEGVSLIAGGGLLAALLTPAVYIWQGVAQTPLFKLFLKNQ